jgi:protein required for attachment to host cells
MLLAHNTEVCVADGRKLLLLVNAGDTRAPDLQVIRQEEQSLGPNRDLSTDRPGRTFNSADSRRSGYEETDFKQLAEERFAIEAAAILNTRALAGMFDKLIVIATPRTLGEMRPRYHKELSTRIIAEIAKEATNLSPDGIARMIAEA